MMSKIKNLFQVPTTIPPGKVLVHNLISHDRNTVPGTNGFRAWFDKRRFYYEICSCGWAPHLGVHYCEQETEEDMGQRLRPLRF